MKPVKQTLLGARGNCAQAALASIFELPLEAVPDFWAGVPSDSDGSEWWSALYAFLESCNLAMFHLSYPDHESALLDLKHRRGYLLVWGKSPRDPQLQHYVVFHRGEMAHDPHPDDSGVLAIGGVDLLYPIDQARALARADAIKRLLHCSFCGSSQHEVVKLIAGSGVYICDECVWQCVRIIEGRENAHAEYDAWLADQEYASWDRG